MEGGAEKAEMGTIVPILENRKTNPPLAKNPLASPLDKGAAEKNAHATAPARLLRSMENPVAGLALPKALPTSS